MSCPNVTVEYCWLVIGWEVILPGLFGMNVTGIYVGIPGIPMKQPTQWDRADRADEPLDMTWQWKGTLCWDDLRLRFGYFRFPMSNPDWNRIPAGGHERGATHYAGCARSLKIEKKHGWSMTVVHVCSSLFINYREQHSSYADPAVHRHSLVTSPSASILRVSHAWEWPMEVATWSSWHVASYPWKFKCIKEMNGFLNMLDDIWWHQKMVFEPYNI